MNCLAWALDSGVNTFILHLPRLLFLKDESSLPGCEHTRIERRQPIRFVGALRCRVQPVRKVRPHQPRCLGTAARRDGSHQGPVFLQRFTQPPSLEQRIVAVELHPRTQVGQGRLSVRTGIQVCRVREVYLTPLAHG